MESKICPACKNENLSRADNCQICEFPFTGSEKEKSLHIGKFISDKGIIIDSEDSLNKSRNLLFLAAGFYILGAIINYSLLLNNLFALVFNVVVILIIVVSGVLLKKSPLIFLSIPLILLITIYAINYLADPNTLINGIIFKMIILGSLGYSIYNYLASKKFKKKYNL
ncbi:hypothetical protein N1F78_12810 [Seonamhaeicola sp. MEBiC1930]|uniref:hypothetical protein n=1 Tax=Seonamhaeicola sp. MEBiC01930 TaxID=2976768 RepID=UPI0032507415